MHTHPKSPLRIRIAFVLALAFAAQAAFAQANWTMVWNDEFTGPNVDLSKWEFEVNGDGGGNNEAQYYTARSQNAYVENGKLVIKAIKEPYTGADGITKQYTSARLRTKNKGDWTYGKIEASIKLPQSVQGIWPAFWMLPTDYKYGTWPKSGEIDIMESVGKTPGQVFGTLHYGAAWPKNVYTVNPGLTPSSSIYDAFHTYGIEWDPTEIRWYFDGTLWQTIKREDVAPFLWPWQEDFHILLNLAVGGAWPGDPSGNAGDFPQTMQVDFVRVWEKDSSREVDGDSIVSAPRTFVPYSTDLVASSYQWSVPSGATIASGQGTNTILVHFPGKTEGDVKCVATTAAGTVTLLRAVRAEESTTYVLDDFDAVRNATYKAATSTGVLTQAVANPSTSGINASAKVGKYVRNVTSQYDTLRLAPGSIALDASSFENAYSTISMDVYTTDIPVGTEIAIKLEDSSRNAQTYPAGRHSTYTAKTTKTGSWETLQFSFSARDGGYTAIASPFAVDEIVVMIASGVYAGYTLYFDNFQLKNDKTPYKLQKTLQNFDGTNALTFVRSEAGTYTPNVANPGPSAVNSSATVGRFVRSSSSLYDHVRFKLGQTIDAQAYMAGAYKFAVDVYTNAPAGTHLSVNLEHSGQDASDVDGVNSSYDAILKSTGTWETLTFSYNSWYDWPIENFGIDEIVLGFDSGNASAYTYYFDNVRVVSRDRSPVVSPRQPFNGPHPIPGKIEAEDFDTGGANVAYSDTTPANQGGAYRTGEQVDLEASSEGGFNVGWIADGEWLEYTISSVEAGTYNVDVRLAALSSGRTLVVTLDGAPVATFAVPVTNGWQNWQTVRVSNVVLTAKTNATLRLKTVGGDFNVQWIQFAKQGTLPVGFSTSGTLPNGLIGGAPVAYTATATYANGQVTIQFDGGAGFEWVWLYTPGFSAMTNSSGTIWSKTLSGYSPGQTVSWYFVVRKAGSEANNAGANLTWTIPSN